MPTNPTFEKLYRKLNKEQKRAVDTIEGPVMVIAGPGTGKTQILTLRIANILKQTDTRPENILALTFTESGVFSMRKRLVEIIGSPAYKVAISTFHGFANDHIKKYPEQFPRIIGSSSITDIDQIRIMEDIIQGSELEYLKPYGDPFYYVRPVLSTIRNLKREDISPKDFETMIKDQAKNFKDIPDLYHEKGAYKGKMKGAYADLQKKIEKNKELVKLYKKYQETLAKQKFYDYEDMIMEFIRALEKSEDFRLQLQEQYQYILADEHQDANNAQNKILELMASFHNDPNLFIVGDEKQAIFRFQGASLENFLYFKKLYPKAWVISLQENYRSTQPILDAAHSLIEKNKVVDKNLRAKLKSQQKTDNSNATPHMYLHEFSRQEYEYAHLAKDIQEKIKKGADASGIAVIYRENKDVLPIVRELEKTDIPFTVTSDQDILSDPQIQKLILLLQVVGNIGRDELLAEALYLDFLGFDLIDVFKITHYAGKKRLGLYDVLKSEEYLTDAKVNKKEKFSQLVERLLMWASVAKNSGIIDFFETIISQSGFVDYLVAQPGALEKMAKLDRFFDEIKNLAEQKRDAKIQDLLKYIEILKSYNLMVKAPIQQGGKNAVQLMTAHKSKGLEFEYIYIIGAYDTHWGNKRSLRVFDIPLAGLKAQGIDPLEDERRLFYVALTRAKKEVHISYSTLSLDGRELLPSQFVSEIDPKLLESVSTEKFETEHSKKHTHAFTERIHHGISFEDKEYLRSLFLEQGISATALNQYLKCPWDYFFNNLLKIPRAKTKYQMYGTAIHHTLKEFFDKYAKEEDILSELFIETFEHNLKREPLNQRDYDEALKKGKEALRGYYKTYYPSWTRRLFTEFSIPAVFFPVQLGDGKVEEILICGKLDKIELSDNNTVTVVDYKTAKPKTHNEIMGKTKNSDGDYYRQLMFYKILLDGYDKGTYKMKAGEIDFIEPDSKDKYHKERFEMVEADIEEVKKTISRVAHEIYNFTFWDKVCEDDCEFCRLRQLVKEREKEFEVKNLPVPTSVPVDS
ncbi:ATP-dependent helicase [Candidatus Parcubacteria bacterium]|nr:ATP-dependent helicase [Candidatus Parcubacteria bacterium]